MGCLKYIYNPIEDIFDAVLNLESPLQFKGEINVPGDFPDPSDVEPGWFFTIGTDVTDDDPTKTNTGQSFEAGDEIAWDGSAWILVGSGIWKRDGTTISPRNDGDDIFTTGDIQATTANLAGLDISNDGTKTTLLGKSGDYTRIGDAATSTILNSEDSLLVTGELEVGGLTYLSGGNGVSVLRFLRSGATQVNIASYSNDGFHIGLRSESNRANNNMIITQSSNVGKDHDHSAVSANPTLFIHSAEDPDTDNTQWISLTHDQTDGVIDVGSGAVNFLDNDITTTETITAGVLSNTAGTITIDAVELAMGMLPITNVGYIDFDLVNGVAQQEGRMVWNPDDGTLNLGMPGGNVIGQILQEMLFRAKNVSGVNILNGQAVRITGGVDGRPEVNLSDPDNTPADHSEGLATEDIENNQSGYVTTGGLVRGDVAQPIDTSGFAEGTILYVSNTPGILTDTRPTGTERIIEIGHVIKSNNESGTIWVSTVNTSYLSELSGNSITSVADDDLLKYDSGTGVWVNVNGSGTGNIGYWNRTGTVLSPVNADDNISTLGMVIVGTNLQMSGPSTITANTISFTDDFFPSQINDSGNGFLDAGFAIGDTITVTGSTGNDGEYMIGGVTAGRISIFDDIGGNESAGATVTITSATSASIKNVTDGGNLNFGTTGSGKISFGTTPIIEFDLQNDRIAFGMQIIPTGSSSGAVYDFFSDSNLNMNNDLQEDAVRIIKTSNYVGPYLGDPKPFGGMAFTLNLNDELQNPNGGGILVPYAFRGIGTANWNFTGTPVDSGNFSWNFPGLLFNTNNNAIFDLTLASGSVKTNHNTSATGAQLSSAVRPDYKNDNTTGTLFSRGASIVSSISDSQTTVHPTELIVTNFGINLDVNTDWNGEGTSYGYYIDNDNGAATNWALYVATATDSFMGLDTAKTYWGTGFDASIYYNGLDLVINPDEFGSGKVKINDVWTLPNVDGSTDDILKTDGSGSASFATPTTKVPISFSMYDAEPARNSETSLDGALIPIATAQPLNSVPTNIDVTKGTGKIIIVVNAGSDLVGNIIVTGTSVDRDTGATTGSDTDTITVDSTTTDNSDTDTNGNARHAFTGAYITSKWFTGTVTLSTTNLTLTDVDVYHASFEQFNDTSNLTLNTFDANILTTSVNAEFDAYLYVLLVTGDKCDITREASLNVGADGETALDDRYWRLRRGNIGKEIDGTTDGVWVDVHYSNSPAYVEDVSIKVWATESASLILT